MGRQYRWEDLPWRDSRTGAPAEDDSDDCYASVVLDADATLLVHADRGGVLGGHGAPGTYDLRWIKSRGVREVFMRPPAGPFA